MKKELLAILAILVLAGCANTGSTEHSPNDSNTTVVDDGWDDADEWGEDDFGGK